MTVDVIILAAGKGTRMHSSLPKVLHQLGGRPMLRHVIDTAGLLAPRKIIVVAGHQYHQVKHAMTDCEDVTWVAQTEQLGTGHAVQQCVPELDDTGISVILYGDVPLICEKTILGLVNAAARAEVVVLSFDVAQPEGLGRIIRDHSGQLQAIVEHKDATAEQKKILEINTGIMAVQNRFLKSAVSRLNKNNAQAEYYLTDIVAMAKMDAVGVTAIKADNEDEIQGINNRLQLSLLERKYQYRIACEMALNGTTLADLNRLDVRGKVILGQDVSIDANVVLKGEVIIGNNVTIGANCVIADTVIGDNVVINEFSHVDGASIARDCSVGPYARLRPGTILDNASRVGNFVEIKKASIGRNSKVNHLSYIGDTSMGEAVNVGAGTITCNYDGVNKHLSRIGDRVFIGSNSSLVAPVRIGDDATIGAGSVVTRDVDNKELVVARARQKHITGWQRPRKTKGREE